MTLQLPSNLPSRRTTLKAAAGLGAMAGLNPNLLSAALRRTQQHENHTPKMEYLENEHVRVGVDLNLGGAITFLADQTHKVNMINSWDWGRQIQMSFYSGPVPYIYKNKRPAKAWAKLGWNPIQVGDHFGNHSSILNTEITPDTIYFKCQPMLWPMNNVQGQCTFEMWLTLSGRAVIVRSRLNNNRPDRTQYPARGQELPAVYTNAPFYKLYSYIGHQPYTHDKVTPIHTDKKPRFPWTHWYTTEKWAALVNEQGWGLGIYQPDAHHYIGGFAGQPGPGGPQDNPTGYFSPIRKEILDHNIQYDYHYHLIPGSTAQIRDYAYAQNDKLTLPSFHFNSDRQGWTYHNMTDTGWPIKEALNLQPHTQPDPQLISPDLLYQAESAPKLKIVAAFKTSHRSAQIFFRRLNEKSYQSNPLSMKIINDAQFHEYIVDLSKHPAYRGLISKIRIDPIPTPDPKAMIKIKSIQLGS